MARWWLLVDRGAQRPLLFGEARVCAGCTVGDDLVLAYFRDEEQAYLDDENTAFVAVFARDRELAEARVQHRRRKPAAKDLEA